MGRPKVPTALAAAVEGYRWARDAVGKSGASVYRLHGKPAAPDLYLKIGAGAVAEGITAETARLRWLAPYLPVPRVIDFIAHGGQAWLLMTAMPGQPACRLLEADPATGPMVVDALAAFMQRVHAIPVETCPFDNALATRLAHARDRIDAGEVDEDDFDEERLGQNAEHVWADLQAMLPLKFDRVVTHGDFTLDNLLIEDGAVVGCIDVGRAGIADRYQDLALLWNCLGEFGEQLQARLFAQYGIDQPDPPRMGFHLLLDELF
ncbi:MAG: aminoglycoside 3'-phosphotransferase [Novosphingobium sp.]